jgi:hypothetical protein
MLRGGNGVIWLVGAGVSALILAFILLWEYL